MSSSRRNFLKTTAAATAFLAAPKAPLLWADSSTGAQVWVTSPKRKFEKVAAPQWRASSSGGATIQLDPSQRYQKILGFGAAFTDASCYMFSQLNDQERTALLTEFFGPSGLRLSVCRTCIGASDYSTSAYSFDDSPEPDPTSRNSASNTTAPTFCQRSVLRVKSIQICICFPRHGVLRGG